MKKAARDHLARIAKDMALLPFHGAMDGPEPNLAPIVRPFPAWSVAEAGDMVLYDRVFENREHDHIGIVLEKRDHTILAAEGNVGNISGIVKRPIDDHIRAYIRIPDGYRYGAE